MHVRCADDVEKSRTLAAAGPARGHGPYGVSTPPLLLPEARRRRRRCGEVVSSLDKRVLRIVSISNASGTEDGTMVRWSMPMACSMVSSAGQRPGHWPRDLLPSCPPFAAFLARCRLSVVSEMRFFAFFAFHCNAVPKPFACHAPGSSLCLIVPAQRAAVHCNAYVVC